MLFCTWNLLSTFPILLHRQILARSTLYFAHLFLKEAQHYFLFFVFSGLQFLLQWWSCFCVQLFGIFFYCDLLLKGTLIHIRIIKGVLLYWITEWAIWIEVIFKGLCEFDFGIVKRWLGICRLFFSFKWGLVFSSALC